LAPDGTQFDWDDFTLLYSYGDRPCGYQREIDAAEVDEIVQSLAELRLSAE